MSDTLEQLKYPIGKFIAPGEITFEQIQEGIEEIAALPAKIRAAVSGLTDEQLDTPYRPEGWTLRQVIHHLPDSHMNAYIRFKFALTEENPTIMPYFEERWAEVGDAKHGPIDSSLILLEGLHARWVSMMTAMDQGDFYRTYYHPANGHMYPLGLVVALYRWHGEHHLQHILVMKKTNGW